MTLVAYGLNQMGKTHSKPLAARHGRGMLCVNRSLLQTWPACAGNLTVRSSQQFNLPYLMAAPRSADLRPLIMPLTF